MLGVEYLACVSEILETDEKQNRIRRIHVAQTSNKWWKWQGQASG